MRINLKRDYKSLKPFESAELPYFTIITGKNGSGKSQLIELFKTLADNVSRQALFSSNFSISPSLNYIHTEPLIIETIGTGNPINYNQQIQSLYIKYRETIRPKAIKIIWANMYLNNVFFSDLNKIQLNTSDDLKKLHDLISSDGYALLVKDLEELLPIGKMKDSDVLTKYRELLIKINENEDIYNVAKYVSERTNHNIGALAESDFFNAGLPEKYFDKNDLIQSRIENIFYSYIKKRELNTYNYLRNREFHEDNPAYSREEFTKQFKEPWNIINRILDEINFPYYFKNIREEDFSRDASIPFHLIKKGVEERIKISDLSSGEKVIMGLVIKLFTSEFYDVDLKYPDLIILDEPDAHLHPQMCNILLQVLNDTFVKKLNIRVIVTTHSPSTVALAPEESIFELSNYPETRLIKVSKDDALKILTSGVPTLSIDYNNHRQVFVESPTDLEYYQTIFRKLNENESPIHQLYFISNGYGKSNCDQVKKLVKDLRESGNKTVFGIIDWDNRNNSNSEISVHGFKSRYSVENYIFDPIYLCVLLCRDGRVKQALNLRDDEIEYDIARTKKGQEAINFIVSKLEPRNKEIAYNKQIVIQKYYDIAFAFPAWFLLMKGHDLKEQLCDEFEILQNMKRGNEYEIEKRLITIIGKVYPFVPEDTLTLLRKVAN